VEAILKKNKVAHNIKSGDRIVLLEAGDRVSVIPNTEHTFHVAEGPMEGLTLGLPEIELLLDVNEVAEHVNRARDTVYSWLRSGVIEGRKVSGPGQGGEWRIPASELDGFTPPKPGPKRGNDA
jgi:excisionase family DNA binding protein